MSTEHKQPTDSQRDNQVLHDNPALWQGGERFQVMLRETEQDGIRTLQLQVRDGKEAVLIEFQGSVREAHTLFLAAEHVPPLSDRAETLPVPGTETAPALAAATTSEAEKKPTKLTGTIMKVGELTETKKKHQPMLLFTMQDEAQHVERRAVAFDSIAQGLAAPETSLQANEPITLFAWKHINTVHIQGEPRQVEDWYIQKAIYHETVFEKPRPKQKNRD